jgi:flavin-dependent dehydrogenase
VVEHVVHTLVVRAGYRRKVARTSADPLVAMTQRRRLDLHLAEQAAAQGVDFRDGVAVAGLVLGDDSVSARVGESRVVASFVVGADGANGLVARIARLGDGIVRGVALEGNVPWDAFGGARHDGTAWVELGVVPGGYGWVFPKGDHANLGVGGWLVEGPRLRSHLERLARVHGADPAALVGVRGHRLPMRLPGTAAGRGNVLLVGDAAGLIDPLSGDGMYEAFVSAELAADSIARARPAEYEPALAAALDHHAAASWKAKRAAERFPGACVWALRAPGVFGAVAGLLRGEIGHPREARGIAQPSLRALAQLAR